MWCYAAQAKAYTKLDAQLALAHGSWSRVTEDGEPMVAKCRTCKQWHIVGSDRVEAQTVGGPFIRSTGR